MENKNLTGNNVQPQPSVYLVSLGCDKNRVDGETMVGNLRAAGFSVVQDAAAAAAIIVNTCGFIKDAVLESIDLVLELAAYKQAGSCKGLVIVGCMSERYRGEIKDSIPEADAILGVKEYDQIAKVVGGLIGMPAAPGQETKFSRMLARQDDAIPHVAYVKIAEGCDNHCTYCTIPSIRGAYVSRQMENILEECDQLLTAGAKEIVLVAQDSALYGKDIYGEQRLPELLYKLADIMDNYVTGHETATEATSNGSWNRPPLGVRVMYCYPEHVTEGIVRAIADIPYVFKYIDMPLQHCEDGVLGRMGRNSSKKSLTALVEKLRADIPGIGIRTTLMVGFPGETSDDFKAMYNFVAKMKFDRMGVFPYSREAGTPAANMPNQVRADAKQRRLNRLMELQQKIHFAKQEEKVGQSLQVLVDSPAENPEEAGLNPAKHNYLARTEQDAYEVDAIVYVESEKPLDIGHFHQVKITEALQYDLKGICE
ncbi:MAG: radical SAM protein [Defluviitaleaceae bacterium]|nr:radical SAM protein [Defluviitaleaceae bacterium]